MHPPFLNILYQITVFRFALLIVLLVFRCGLLQNSLAMVISLIMFHITQAKPL
jgi:hypothetical protein